MIMRGYYLYLTFYLKRKLTAGSFSEVTSRSEYLYQVLPSHGNMPHYHLMCLTRWLRHYFEKNLKNHHQLVNLQLHVTHTSLHFQISKRGLLWKIILSFFKWWKFQRRISFPSRDTADRRERGKNSPNYVYIYT